MLSPLPQIDDHEEGCAHHDRRGGLLQRKWLVKIVLEVAYRYGVFLGYGERGVNTPNTASLLRCRSDASEQRSCPSQG